MGCYVANGAQGWSAQSDERLKNIVAPITNALDKISRIRNVIYTLKSDTSDMPVQHMGVIAQDVQKVAPEVVTTGYEDYLGVNYAQLMPLAFAGINELSLKLDAVLAKLG